MADFIEHGQDEFRPNYGGISWTTRLNFLLEATGVELTPMAYTEGVEPMQINQENTIVYINQVADEMDCIAVKYDYDAEDVWTFYWRHAFKNASLEEVTNIMGVWATQIVSLYPQRHIVEQYESHQTADLDSADHVPDDWA